MSSCIARAIRNECSDPNGVHTDIKAATGNRSQLRLLKVDRKFLDEPPFKQLPLFLLTATPSMIVIEFINDHLQCRFLRILLE